MIFPRCDIWDNTSNKDQIRPPRVHRTVPFPLSGPPGFWWGKSRYFPYCRSRAGPLRSCIFPGEIAHIIIGKQDLFSVLIIIDQTFLRCAVSPIDKTDDKMFGVIRVAILNVLGVVPHVGAVGTQCELDGGLVAVHIRGFHIHCNFSREVRSFIRIKSG